MVYTIWFQVDLIRFGKYFSVCIQCPKDLFIPPPRWSLEYCFVQFGVEVKCLNSRFWSSFFPVCNLIDTSQDTLSNSHNVKFPRKCPCYEGCLSRLTLFHKEHPWDQDLYEPSYRLPKLKLQNHKHLVWLLHGSPCLQSATPVQWWSEGQ